jgi:hypothetical protein
LDAAVVFAMGETHWGILCLEGLLVLLVLSYARAFSPTRSQQRPPKRAG